MKKMILSCTTIAGTVLMLLLTTSANAQATRTWVSGVGDDANPCSRTAPCKTFAGAISKTFINGEINCIDPGGFGAVTITKSITIDCHEVFASILASGTTGIIINITPNGNDPAQTVRLRNLNINGTGAAGSVGVQTGLNGIRIMQARMVYIEDVLVSDFSQNGIFDQRTAGGRLNILNTTLRNNLGAGILVSPTSGSMRIDVDMDRVTSAGNNEGMVFNNGPRVQINNSSSSNNTDEGVASTSSVGSTTVNINRSMVSNNGGAAMVTNGTSMLRFSDTDIAFNGTGFSGTTLTFGSSRITGNLVIGTVPTHMGGTFDQGQI
ncbi:MAG: right-handed parallel beta-helix repeat-containing protein [Casimicrobiaceae bacterium]